MKNILLRLDCIGVGDTLCIEPTIRKISSAYGTKVDLAVKPTFEWIYKNHPAVNKIFTLNDNSRLDSYGEIFELYNTGVIPNFYSRSINEKKLIDSKTIELKLSILDIRQIPAISIGITLHPDELSCYYFPDPITDRILDLTKNKYVVFHVTDSWPTRTWKSEYWQELYNLIYQYTDYNIVLIGLQHNEAVHNGVLEKKVTYLQGDRIINLSNDVIGDEMWHLIANSECIITPDSGPLHIAGTTDTSILQIGTSTRYETRAPWRNGTQKYKFDFVEGTCSIYCGSDLKYSVSEHGTINSMPLLLKCQEDYDEMYCHPLPDKVFSRLLKLLCL